MTNYRDMSEQELISTIISERQGEKISLKLLENFSSLADLLIYATEEELSAIEGVSSAKIKKLKATSELARRLYTIPLYKNIQITNPQTIADILIPEMRFLKQESFRVVLLNAKNKIIDITEISRGTISSTQVHPREIFSLAIKRFASSIIVAHNHPSGDPQPSSIDISITRKLVESGNIIGINVVDHLIIGDGCYLSFAEKNLL